MKHPCTRTCPDRSAECRLICEKWKAFELEKLEDYKRRSVDYGAFVVMSKRNEKSLKRRMMHK